MPEVPPIPAPIPFPTGVSAQVIGAEVEISEDQRAFVLALDLADLDGTPLRENPRSLALSLPAAARLSRALAQALEKHLYGSEEDQE